MTIWMNRPFNHYKTKIKYIVKKKKGYLGRLSDIVMATAANCSARSCLDCAWLSLFSPRSPWQVKSGCFMLPQWFYSAISRQSQRRDYCLPFSSLRYSKSCDSDPKQRRHPEQNLERILFDKVFLSPCRNILHAVVLHKVGNFMSLLSLFMLAILSPVTDEPVYRWTCFLIPNRCFRHSATSADFGCPCSNLFCTCCSWDQIKHKLRNTDEVDKLKC